MKLIHCVAAVIGMLFAALLLQAQEVGPTSLTLVAVPGYTSSPQSVFFKNTGDSQITLTVSITGPFAIPTNSCGRGVKPGTHCNVYVTYKPVAIETDTGTLTFSFNGQTVSVPLTGDGVSVVPTSTKGFSLSKKKQQASWTLFAEGDVIPNGELGFFHCIDFEGVNEQNAQGPFVNNKVIFSLDTFFDGDHWNDCMVYYNGDAEFAETSWIFNYHPCEPGMKCFGE